MPFDGGALAEGNTKVKDYSGYGNNGTVVGAVYNPTGGYDNLGAYEFNNFDSYIEVDDQSLNIKSDLTISVWAKL